MSNGWNHQFGVIDTIYEEEPEFSSTSSSPSLSPPSFSSSPPLLHSTISAWSLSSGHQTDLLLRVQGTCFRLHKDRIISRSSYLKRHLTNLTEFTLSPPLNITPHTFAAIAEFCYSSRVHLTPNNVAAIRTAAGLLGMTDSRGYDGENLCHVAESYFNRIVGIDQEYASVVLRSCMALLPEAETTASLVSRCIEALVWDDYDGHDIDATCLNVVVEIRPQDFQSVVDSINARLPHHDVLYRMIDLYFKENKNGKLTEEQKSQLCNSIDCTKLSPPVLMECVQNPRVPLRFIVRAMLVEHLNTRRSIAVAAAASGGNQQDERESLGDILRRDSARRQTAQLKEAMDSTCSRIQSLEKELNGMRKILLDHHAADAEQQERKLNALNSERSASFHVMPAAAEERKIGRGGRGSVSSSALMYDGESGTPRMTKSLRQRLMSGLKNAFHRKSL
ncbi:BTB/POZ domain-containing protein At3g49900 [Arachis ipaensis]|uniref:BTB/POZ domain-containing protein At3g49900 n=1 Tax=Arachis ipaensis TaxID=130454 RepID=UPI0007AF7B6C|nr:BTB/POZ domain-containing protein At3g49900 [Arachis ipaensis]XP_025652308.1 BTB/POZ domain-containing protein At3g49900 [Arachis hypogaea]